MEAADDGETQEEAQARVASPRSTRQLLESLRALPLAALPRLPVELPERSYAVPRALAAIRRDALHAACAGAPGVPRAAARAYLRITEQCLAQTVSRQWVLSELSHDAVLSDLRYYFVFDTPLFSAAFARDAMRRGRAWSHSASSAFFRMD